MRVTVGAACVGHGVCESLADEVFAVGDDGVSHVLTDPVPTGREDAVTGAVRACPARALSTDG
jgi:ferredoxin